MTVTQVEVGARGLDDLTSVVERYAGLVRSVVRGFRLSEAEAADAVQTTWLRLVEHSAEIEHPERVGGWLRTTAHRVCLEALRRRMREQPVETCPEGRLDADGLRPAADDDPEATVLRHERAALVRAALAGLPERQRTFMTLLSGAAEPSYREVSRALDMPVGSIGPTRARMLSRLRTALESAGLDGPGLS